MINRSLSEVASMISGEISDESYNDLRIKGVSTDSRTIDYGNLYIPLIGEVYDGRLFIKECEDKGAKAFIIDKNYKVKNNISIPYIVVDDTKKALQDLAAAYRNQLSCKFVAITGSNGKTTTKDLLDTVLKVKYKTQKTLGNLNNEIGVPKTLLNLDEDTEIAIVELGTDNFGDISLTTSLVRPDIAAITNIGDSHLHNLKTKSGILKAKLEILEGMNDDGIFIYNIDDPTMSKEIPSYDIKQKVLSFGKDERADFRFDIFKSSNTNLSFSHEGETYSLPLIGEHNAYNAALVVMISEIFKLSKEEIDAGFLKVKASTNRSELIQADGFDILDDSYKSNPQSLLAGLETCNMLEGYENKILCLADMLELGSNEEKLHYQVGEKINNKKISYCLFYGPLSYHMYEASLKNFPKNKVFHFNSKDELIEKLKSLITKSSLVFVKGSHGMHMEEIVDSIKSFNV